MNIPRTETFVKDRSCAVRVIWQRNAAGRRLKFDRN